MRTIIFGAAALLACGCAAEPASAPDTHNHTHTGGIAADTTSAADTAFDIVHAKVSTDSGKLVFHMGVSGQAGASKPSPSGKLAGADVFSYVWPTSLDSHAAGFDSNAGILALAVTAHPDFDDTPREDENGDGDKANDGDLWHSHWVVLAPNETCGPRALGVIDIPEGAKPRLPPTWPGLPILIDSPGFRPEIGGDRVEVRVPLEAVGGNSSFSFDGVTAGLRVNQSVHAPLLCVVNVFDVASGDLSLPGKVE